jgi:hypothetical protein
VASPQDAAEFGRSGGRPVEPDEEAAIRAALDEIDEEKRRALAEPGPSWGDWFFFKAAKAYLVLLYLIVDVWIGVGWVNAGAPLLAVPSLAAAIYLELLLYRYLWYAPEEPPYIFRPSLITPVRYGRWTPEGRLLRRGASLSDVVEGPNLDEFL